MSKRQASVLVAIPSAGVRPKLSDESLQNAGTQALTQQYARLQQQLALMAQQNGGGFPFLPPPSMGTANPFSGLNAQQVIAFALAFLRCSASSASVPRAHCCYSARCWGLVSSSGLL